MSTGSRAQSWGQAWFENNHFEAGVVRVEMGLWGIESQLEVGGFGGNRYHLDDSMPSCPWLCARSPAHIELACSMPTRMLRAGRPPVAVWPQTQEASPYTPSGVGMLVLAVTGPH